MVKCVLTAGPCVGTSLFGFTIDVARVNYDKNNYDSIVLKEGCNLENV